MPCFYCRYFDKDEMERPNGGIVEEVRKTTGTCTLSPDWRRVTGLHYCSRLALTEPMMAGRFWVNMHEGWIEVRKERELRRAAEKKLKEYRAKQRARKAVAAVAEPTEGSPLTQADYNASMAEIERHYPGRDDR